MATITRVKKTTIYSLLEKDGDDPKQNTERNIAAGYQLSVGEIFENPIVLDRKATQKRDHIANDYKGKDSLNSTTFQEKYPSHLAKRGPNVPVVGFIEAGAFREMGARRVLDSVYFGQPEYDRAEKTAWVVNGHSGGDEYPAGTRVIVLEYTPDELQMDDCLLLRRQRGAHEEIALGYYTGGSGNKLRIELIDKDGRTVDMDIQAGEDVPAEDWQPIGIVIGESKKRRRSGQPGHNARKHFSAA
jgi:hypothetical protein